MRSLLILTILTASLAHAAWLDYEEARELRVPAAGLDELLIDAGAGKLTVTAVDGADAVLVLATIVVPDTDDDDARELIESSLALSLEVDGSRARLESTFDLGSRRFGESPRVDLEVRVPRSLALTIDDGSGAIVASGLGAALTIEDGSGSIVINDVAGPVSIEDGSGSIRVTGVGGDLTIVDGSGSITARDIGGSVILDDGSGSIDVRDVEADLVVLEDGSGSLEYSGIGGSIDDRS